MKEERTIGDMIAELEADYESMQKANQQIEKLKMILTLAEEKDKKMLLTDFLIKHEMHELLDFLTPNK